MITVQGSEPLRTVPEQQILPRLKLTTQPPNFDFTKLRQQLIDNTDDQTRIRLIRGLHEPVRRMGSSPHACDAFWTRVRPFRCNVVATMYNASEM